MSLGRLSDWVRLLRLVLKLTIMVLLIHFPRLAGFAIYYIEHVYPPLAATIIHCDNVSVMNLSTNHVQHQHTKHIKVDIPFVIGKVALGQVRVLHVLSSSQYVDIFTKGLPSMLFIDFRSKLNIRSRTPVPTTGAVRHIL